MAGLTRLRLRGYKRGFAFGRGAGSGAAALSRIGCPAQYLQISAGIFDKGCAAFNPVSVVEVENATDLPNLGLVDVSADHAVDATRFGCACDGCFKSGDVLDGVLDLLLKERGKRPMGKAHCAAHHMQHVT